MREDEKSVWNRLSVMWRSNAFGGVAPSMASRDRALAAFDGLGSSRSRVSPFHITPVTWVAGVFSVLLVAVFWVPGASLVTDDQVFLAFLDVWEALEDETGFP